jgi:hypothetical protein
MPVPGRAELPPLFESGGSIEFEIVSRVEVALEVARF